MGLFIICLCLCLLLLSIILGWYFLFPSASSKPSAPSTPSTPSASSVPSAPSAPSTLSAQSAPSALSAPSAPPAPVRLPATEDQLLQAFSIRDAKEKILGIKPGDSTKCTGFNPRGDGAVYRYSGTSVDSMNAGIKYYIRYYPNPKVADSWDKNWANAKTIDCTGFTDQDPMEENRPPDDRFGPGFGPGFGPR
jgi:hypothetical protein